MMDKYTPDTRERKHSQPNTNASKPGTNSIITSAQIKYSLPSQNHGNSLQLRNTIKSGSWALP